MPKITHNLVLTEKDLTLAYAAFELAPDKVLKFSTPERMAKKRVDTLLTKEPMTIVWLNGMNAETVLFDVGGNVGMYSIYAGKLRGARVFAFEPESLNYAELNKNIYLNGLHQRVTAFCVGISDRFAVDRLYLSAFRPSYSHHDAGENRWEGPVTRIAESQASRLPQGCVMVPLDQFVVGTGQWLPQPTHLKIDVDGLEHLVVAGAKAILASPTLESVLLETDFRLPRHLETMNRLTSSGWHYSMDQVCVSGHGRESPATFNERIRTGKGGANIIYYRAEHKDKYERLFAEAAFGIPVTQ